jgi:hypothetical protein
VPARRRGASHGGASVVLKEEKWMGGLSSIWGASESEDGCVWVYAKSLESMLNRGGSGVHGHEQQCSSLIGQNGQHTGQESIDKSMGLGYARMVLGSRLGLW